jgi:hypothetical protein
VSIAATGATDHHLFAIDDLAEIVRGLSAACVILVGLYAPHAEFTNGEMTTERIRTGEPESASTT